MPKRGSDADSRTFFDELASIGVSRLRATGAIKLEDQWVRIPVGEQTKLIGVAHTKFPNGGSWSFFVCSTMRAEGPKGFGWSMMRRAVGCLEKLGVRYHAAYGFWPTERLKERDRRAVDRLPGSVLVRRHVLAPAVPRRDSTLMRLTSLFAGRLESFSSAG